MILLTRIIIVHKKGNVMETKKRIFGFDFIRMIATISIVIIHYNAIYLYLNPQRTDLTVLTNTFSNIYLGAWGVSLFFILSGASLMYVYQDKLDLKIFYKKRFMSIYPMFWIAYIIVLLVQFYLYKGFSFGQAPISNFILTIIGFDGNLMTIVPTFYILGEWFLGCIIAMYIVFPILKFLVDKVPLLTASLILIIFIYMENYYSLPLARDVIFLTRLPELCFGMYFVKYIKKIKFSVFLMSIAVIIANWLIKPTIPNDIQVLYIGITSFNVLMYISDYLKHTRVIVDISNYISKYSYPIFLTHHVIIAYVTSTFFLEGLSKKGSYVLFVICFILTLLASKLLYVLEKKVVSMVRYYISNTNLKLKER